MIFLVAGLGVLIFPQQVFDMQSRAVGYLAVECLGTPGNGHGRGVKHSEKLRRGEGPRKPRLPDQETLGTLRKIAAAMGRKEVVRCAWVEDSRVTERGR